MSSSPQLPPGYSIRPPTLAGLDKVVALDNAISLAEVGEQTSSADVTRMFWEEPTRTLADDNWVIAGPNGRLVADANVYTFAPWTVCEFEAHVHPEHTGLGLGSALLEAVEARARRDLPRAPARARVTLVGMAHRGNAPAQALLAACGFRAVRLWKQMAIATDQLPPTPVPAPDGIDIRTLRRGVDEHAVWLASEEAFEDHWNYAPMPYEEFLYFRVDGAPDFDAELWFVAWDGAEIAGVAICRTRAEGMSDTGRVSLLGVRRPWRRRGVGLALLDTALRAFQQRGQPRVSLSVDGSSQTDAWRLYERAGLRTTHESTVFEKELRGGV
jgi:mycothiol synthase